MTTSKTTRGAGGVGVGFCEVLGIVFIVLKLVGVIDWKNHESGFGSSDPETAL